ncbi:hypothetical protein VNO77_03629 [Canavalia gladiata]|uniref:Uncharacterized protein n=1 Tax=Canavalia gladiata TaxID=3824 RepID=A0AAN9MV78_CANGL
MKTELKKGKTRKREKLDIKRQGCVHKSLFFMGDAREPGALGISGNLPTRGQLEASTSSSQGFWGLQRSNAPRRCLDWLCKTQLVPDTFLMSEGGHEESLCLHCLCPYDTESDEGLARLEELHEKLPVKPQVE